MPRPELDLRAYRRLAQLSLLAAVAVTVAGLYALLVGAWAWGLVGLGLGILLLLPSQWAQIRSAPGSEEALVFVTKRDCSLCEEARLLLPRLTEGTTFRVQAVFVEENRFLRRHFKNAVPVLLWQGEELARLQWDMDAVRRRLQEIQTGRRSPNEQQSP